MQIHPRVLIAAEYSLMLQVVESMLMAIGFRKIAHARNAEQALTRLQGASYGLVIAEWDMKPKSGLDLLTAMRLDDRLLNIPFIMLSTASLDERAAAAKEAGADGLLAKPFDMAQLRDMIATCLIAAAQRRAEEAALRSAGAMRDARGA